jgi:hypothetical protein
MISCVACSNPIVEGEQSFNEVEINGQTQIMCDECYYEYGKTYQEEYHRNMIEANGCPE